MAIYAAVLATVEEIRVKTFKTTRGNTIFMQLPHVEAMVNGIKGLFEIDKDNCTGPQMIPDCK